MRRLLLTALPVLTFVTPAHASERGAARAFAGAARAYTQGVWEAKPAIKAAIDASRADRRLCRELAPAALAVGPDSKRADRLLTIAILRGFAPIGALADVEARFVAALDAIPTRDPLLSSGRAAWRKDLAETQALARLPADTCAQLQAWGRGGRRGLPLPGAIADAVIASSNEPPDERLARAAKRLRALGEGPRRSARFTGDAAAGAIAPFINEFVVDALVLADKLTALADA